MLKLYFSRGSSALAAHILLEDAHALYTTQEVSIPQGQHLSPEFLRLSPKGRVPVLETTEGVISENPAILEYIAARHPDANLLPQGVFEQAKARSLCAYLCATAHVAFAHKHRGARWVDDSDAVLAMQQKVPQNLVECAAYLEKHVMQGAWALGDDYSFCDPYLFLFGRWMAANTLTLDTYPKLAAHHAAMRARRATITALMAHGLG